MDMDQNRNKKLASLKSQRPLQLHTADQIHVPVRFLPPESLALALACVSCHGMQVGLG